MTSQSPSLKTRPAGRVSQTFLRTSLLGAVALTLAACNTTGSQKGPHDPRFMNYDERHPLMLRQQEHTLPLMVGANAHGLTGGDEMALSGFIQSYTAQGEGSLRVRVPQGSANAQAATRALTDIHDVVSAAGGNPSAILVERYQVGNPSAHAPIMMVFDRLEAVTNECGDWSDRFNPALLQADNYNFGCATQANFGAMLEDPRDLVRPRGLGHPDAGRRAEVLALYRRGQVTATQTSQESDANVAEVD